MYADPTVAQAFIRRQLGEYLLLGITTMTAKQQDRMARLEVITEDSKQLAAATLVASSRFYGRPPHQRTGRMRRLNMVTGEIEASVRVSD